MKISKKLHSIAFAIITAILFVTLVSSMVSAQVTEQKCTQKAQNNLEAHFDYCVDRNTVHFFDISSGNPISWEWSFGQDSAHSEQRHPVFTYTDNAPTHLVTLSIRDAQGRTSQIDERVNVIGVSKKKQNNLEARFSYCVEGKTVIFSDESSGNPVSWEWSFGQGSAGSQEKNPIFTYTDNELEHLVILSVKDAQGHGSNADARVPIIQG